MCEKPALEKLTCENLDDGIVQDEDTSTSVCELESNRTGERVDVWITADSEGRQLVERLLVHVNWRRVCTCWRLLVLLRW